MVDVGVALGVAVGGGGVKVAVAVLVLVDGAVGDGVVIGVAVTPSLGVSVGAAVGGGAVGVGLRVSVGVKAAAHPFDVHASQQLVKCPTHALPPRGATHFAALFLMEHHVRPRAVVRQQVTAPGRPQMELAAQCLTWTEQAFGKEPLATAIFTTWLAH